MSPNETCARADSANGNIEQTAKRRAAAGRQAAAVWWRRAVYVWWWTSRTRYIVYTYIYTLYISLFIISIFSGFLLFLRVFLFSTCDKPKITKIKTSKGHGYLFHHGQTWIPDAWKTTTKIGHWDFQIRIWFEQFFSFPLGFSVFFFWTKNDLKSKFEEQ